MLKNHTLKNGTSHIGLYGSATPHSRDHRKLMVTPCVHVYHKSIYMYKISMSTTGRVNKGFKNNVFMAINRNHTLTAIRNLMKFFIKNDSRTRVPGLKQRLRGYPEYEVEQQLNRNKKIYQRKLISCLIGTANNKSQIVTSTPRSRKIFIGGCRRGISLVS